MHLLSGRSKHLPYAKVRDGIYDVPNICTRQFATKKATHPSGFLSIWLWIVCQ